ncbi:MAG: type II secretion system F family protein [Eubacterium sp.]|nr:type II secretion system F family protein [Eubacterium sp.]
MARFKYVITDKYGKEKRGVTESISRDQAIANLTAEGSVVMEIHEAASLDDAAWNITIGNPVKKKDITVFCKQFASILNAGVTLIEGLHMVTEQTENKALKKSLVNVTVAVEKGDTLANAMKAEGKVFPELLIHMVAAGEVTGNLELSFTRICDQFDKDLKLSSMVKSAMIYPIVVLVIAVIVVIILLKTVIPNFQTAFDSLGTELPALTKAVVAASEFMQEHFVGLILGITAFIAVIMVLKNTEQGKILTSKFAVKFPLTKDLTVKNASAKFAMTMSTLIMSGVSVVESLEIVADVISNRMIRQAIKDCRGEVMEGIPMSEPLESSGYFPPMMTHMIKIGEETGTTEQMLDKVAEYYEEEVAVATKNLTTLMEPITIVFLAVIVGGILGSVMMPMLSIYDAVGKG